MVKTQLILGLPWEIVFGVITDNYLYLQSVFTHVARIRRRWKKEFNSHRIGLGHQHGRRFIVLGHQYDRRNVIWKHSIALTKCKKERDIVYYKLFWYKVFVHWKLKLLNFLVDSVLNG